MAAASKYTTKVGNQATKGKAKVIHSRHRQWQKHRQCLLSHACCHMCTWKHLDGLQVPATGKTTLVITAGWPTHRLEQPAVRQHVLFTEGVGLGEGDGGLGLGDGGWGEGEREKHRSDTLYSIDTKCHS